MKKRVVGWFIHTGDLLQSINEQMMDKEQDKIKGSNENIN